MAYYNTIRLGRLTMREDRVLAESSGADGRAISLTGQEAMPGKTLLQVNQRRNDILNSRGEFVEIIFNEKPEFNGFYQVQDTAASVENWDGTTAVVDWSATATRVGSENEVDVESRLSGATTRTNSFAVVGKRWHAPAVNHKAYWAGTTAPISVSRTSEDGSIKVYQNLAQGINPRWGTTLADYAKGRVRFVDSNALERVGNAFSVTPLGWYISNGLIKVEPKASSGTVRIGTWTGSAYAAKDWDVQYDTGPAVSFGTPDYVSVLSNSYDAVTVRLVKSLSPVGRSTLDLIVRRGATFVEAYLQHEFGTTLKIGLVTPEAGTGSTGYISATANDANGFKYVIGSALTYTGDNPNGAISKAATGTLDAYFGVSLNATAGNAPADLQQQYIGSPSEMVRGVKR